MEINEFLPSENVYAKGYIIMDTIITDDTAISTPVTTSVTVTMDRNGRFD